MVGKICTVCKSCSLKSNNLSFFTYPGDPQRRYKWLQAVHRLDLFRKLENNKTRGNHRICELHFEEKYVRKSSARDGRKYLTKDAYPTLELMTLTTEELVEPPSSLPAHQEHFKHVNVHEDLASVPSSDASASEFCESVIKVSKGTQTQRHVMARKVRTVRGVVQPSNSEDNTSKHSFLEQCYKFLPDSMSQIIKWHLSSLENQECVNLHLFALHLYYSSNSFNLIKEVMSLPTVDTLKHFLVPKTNKLSNRFLKALKIKVSNMSTKERVCSLSVGSMNLKPHLYYNIQSDRLIGFHEINGCQAIESAKYAILLMVQGILEDWTQPIAYSFVSEYESYPEISSWIDEVITLLLDIGLDIQTFVIDPRHEYMFGSDTRDVTIDRTYFTNNNRNIFLIYDSEQLAKEVRNAMKTCHFLFNSQLASQDDTIDFYKKLNILTCMLNAKFQNSNSTCQGPLSNDKYEINFMEEMCMLFQNLRVIHKVDGVDVTDNMKFVKHFQISINSVMQLYINLNLAGVKYLITSRLSNSCLNALFARAQKLGGDKECTPRQFNRCFNRSLISNLFKKPLKPCSSDNSAKIEHLLNEDELESSEDNSTQPLKVHTTDYRLSLPEKNAFVFVCGYCYLKCIRRHCCDTLKNYLKYNHQSQDRDDLSYLCGVKLLNDNFRNCRILPPDNFTEFLMLLENKFKEYLLTEKHINSIGQDILKSYASYKFNMPCSCFPLEYLKTLFVRLRIFYTIRKNNKVFRRLKGAKIFRVYSL